MTEQAGSNIDQETLVIAAVKLFFNITERWGLNDNERQSLLGDANRESFCSMKIFWTEKSDPPMLPLLAAPPFVAVKLCIKLR